jgi:hypothetical protein
VSKEQSDSPESTKTTLTPAERRRRKQRRSWIPTVVILGVIIAAIAAAGAFQATNPGVDPKVPAGNSSFTLAGLKVVDGAADAQLNVRKPITSASVGLPTNSTKTFGPFSSIALEVDLTGTHGVASIFVDTMKVVTKDGVLRTISTRTHSYGYSDIHNQLQTFTALGITNLQLAAFQNAMPDGVGGPTSHFSLAVGTGSALGVPTHVTVSCNGAKGCDVTTTTTLLTK